MSGRLVQPVELLTIVGHLAPDLDCLAAMWILMRFGGAEDADLAFVPAGSTLDGRPADSDRRVAHVDTGGGRFDHHQRHAPNLSAAELVRRAVAPRDPALERVVQQVTQIDNATERQSSGMFHINALVAGYNLLFPKQPQNVVHAMRPNLDAWYEHEAQQIRRVQAPHERIDFETPWGPGVAIESDAGVSSKMAYGSGAVLYAYRDANGWMGIVAQASSDVDLTSIYLELQARDPGADWYLHASRRMLLCGTPKAPPRTPSQLALTELVAVIEEATLADAPALRTH